MPDDGTSNRILLGGSWYPIDNLSEHPLSRLHSVTYRQGTVWQIAFGRTVLELTPEQGMELKAWLKGVESNDLPEKGIHDDNHPAS